MPYPALPILKQYPGFPNIPDRAIPVDDTAKDVDNSSLALHSDSSPTSAESLGAPKKMDLGVLRLWLEGGGRTSKAFDDGPSVDYGKLGITRPPSAGENGFNLAPGTDETKVSIRWEVYGLANIKSAKLELYATGIDKPVWEHHWGDAWGKKNAEIADFQVKTGEKAKVTAKGTAPFTIVKLDTGVQAANAAGVKAAAFPAALLTVARSPYELRLTVSSCASGATDEKDKLVYPMTAWTHLHVLIESFDYKFGDPKWLKPRDDIDPAYKDLIQGQGSTKGLEETLIENLRGFVKGDGDNENMNKDTRHVVALDAAYNKSWADESADFEFEIFKKMWGQGARIPLTATAQIRTLEKKGTKERAGDVMVGASLLWDWSESDPKRIETLTSGTTTFGDGKKSAAFLTSLLKESSENNWPTGSFNCPVDLGGKHGDTAAPVFIAPPDPYKFVACQARTSGAVTTFDDKGKTAVIFWPSRFAADIYDVKTYLVHDGCKDHDRQEELADPPTAVGSPGVFTVHRRIGVHHLVIGNLPGIDITAMRDAVKLAARSQARVLIDFVVPNIGPFATFMKEVYKNLIVNSNIATVYPFGGLELPTLIKLDQAGDWLFKIAASASHRATMDALFRNGTIRMVKRSFKLVEDGLGSAEQVTGASGSKGYLLDLGHKTADGQEVVYAITEPTQPAFTDGETATGLKGTARTLTYAVAGHKSCWDVDIGEHNNAALGKVVRVTMPGQKAIDLAFKREGVTRNYGSTMTDELKKQVKTSFDAAVKAFTDGLTFTVRIEGEQGGSSRSTQRMAAVKAYVEELAKTSLVERSKVGDAFRLQSNVFYGMDASSFAAAAAGEDLYRLVSSSVAYTYAKQAALTEALVVVHSSRASSLTSNPDAIGTKALKVGTGNYTDFNSGGYVARGAAKEKRDQIGLREPALAKVALIELCTPDPGAATTYTTRAVKKAWAVMLHEVGHALWLNHAQAREGQVGASSVMPGEHVAGESCLMSYDAEADQLCGLCMLRVRGWRWKSARRQLAGKPRTVTFRLGNVNSIFSIGATTPRGKLERMQVLGLFNRPLGLEGDDHFGTEFEDCRKYSWDLTKELLPGVDGKPGEVFENHLKTYLIEDGAIPGPTAEARLRVFGHYHPYYANMDMALRYMDATLKTARENQFKVMANRGDVEAMTLGANAALGAYPIEVLVTDDKGAAAPGEEVWIELIPPKPPVGAFDPAFAGKKLLGATSFVKGVTPPAFDTPALGRVKKWIDDNVVAHDPSGADDPQKPNAHHLMGGKRRMFTDGDVHTPDADGQRNVFTPSAGSALSAPIDKAGKKVPHAILVRTDMDGVARFLFTPSVIGGDTYRLKATVREGDDKTEVGSAETGNLVVWRTLRIGGYWQMPTQARLKDFPPSMAYYAGHVSRETKLLLCNPLPTFDFKTSVGLELARSYCEVLFEDAALKPTPLPGGFWDEVRRQTHAYDDKHVELIAMITSGTPCRVGLAKTGDKTYSGKVSGKVRRWNLGVVVPDAAGLAGLMSMFAQIDPSSSDWGGGDVVNLVNTVKGDPVFSYEDDMGLDSPFLLASVVKSSTRDNVDVTAGSTFNYATNEVTVVLTTAITPPPPKMVGNFNPNWYGKVHSVTGGTLDNTFEGKLFIRLQKRGSSFDFFFYKDARRRKEDMVASATGKKADTKNVRTKQVGKSGITIEFDVTAAPDDSVAMMWAGVDHLLALWAPEKAVDREAVIEAVDRSPWLFNYASPEVYNSRRDALAPKAPNGPFLGGGQAGDWFENAVGKKSDHTFGETVFMRSTSAALRGGQGVAFYPGQLYLHAHYCGALSSGLRGKGTGNTAFLFDEGATSPDMLHYLALHETGHCLYGPHAWKESGFVDAFHDPDHGMVCIMGGAQDLEHPSEAIKSLRTFCGKCSAGLRGMLIMEPPLYPTSESSKQDAPTPGDAKTARRPKTGSVTGGLVLPTAPSTDAHPTPTPTVTVIDPGDQVPVDDDQDVEVDDMIFIPQEQPSWCWAAASQTMRQFFGKEKIASQTALVKEATGQKADTMYGLVLVGLKCTASAEGTPLDFQAIVDEIDANRPFIMGDTQHYYIVYGYALASKKVLMWNPLPVGHGAKERYTYDQYCAMVRGGYGGHGANYYKFAKK